MIRLQLAVILSTLSAKLKHGGQDQGLFELVCIPGNYASTILVLQPDGSFDGAATATHTLCAWRSTMAGSTTSVR